MDKQTEAIGMISDVLAILEGMAVLWERMEDAYSLTGTYMCNKVMLDEAKRLLESALAEFDNLPTPAATAAS